MFLFSSNKRDPRTFFIIDENNLNIYNEFGLQESIDYVTADFPTLDEALKKHIKSEIRIILNIGISQFKKLQFPDIGATNISQKLKDKINTSHTKHHIAHPIITERPSGKNINWIFMLLEASLHNKLLKLLQHLINKNYRIKTIHLGLVEKIQLAQKILVDTFKDVSSNNVDNFFIVYVEDKTSIHELLFKNNTLIELKTLETSKSNIAQQLVFDMNRTKESLIFNNMAKPGKIFKLIICSEEMKKYVKKFVQCTALSYAELHEESMLLSQSTLDNLLCKNVTASSAIKISALKKFSLIKNILNLGFICNVALMSLLLLGISYYAYNNYINEKTISSMKAEYIGMEKDLEEKNLALSEKAKTLDKETKTFYRIIKYSNQHPLEILKTIKSITNYDLTIKSFLFVKDQKHNVTTLDIFMPNCHEVECRSYLDNISNFIGYAKQKVNKNTAVTFYRATKEDNTYNDPTEGIPMKIEILERLEER